MLFGLVLSGILVAAQEPQMQAGACSTVSDMKGKTAPGSQDAVVHGALLYFGDAFAGAVYGTQSGSVWYQGTGKFSEPISSSARDRAMAMLGITKSNTNAMIVSAPKPSFADALAPDVKLRGCF